MLLTANNILTVSQLNREVRRLLEEHIGDVWVEGEISNLRKQASGHQYFTLKDKTGQLSCVLFRGAAAAAGSPRLADGQQMQVFGELSVYEARGQYQLTVKFAQPRGLGALQARFEALKRTLQAEGLFDAANKKDLPKFPNRIALVTSPTGAAVRDMLNILSRRAPWIELLIVPVRVQGEGAAEEIARALQELDAFEPTPDLVVVTRGGGSLEDLWAFNEEILARAIHACRLPVVSAVGHEIDFTIADFVADLRAPTPSAAAELITPDREELRRALNQQLRRIVGCLRETLARCKARLQLCERSVLLREPPRRLAEARQRLDEWNVLLARTALDRVKESRARVQDRLGVLREHRPDQLLKAARESLDRHRKTLGNRGVSCIETRRSRLREGSDKLRLLGPQATLERGYTLTLDGQGRLLRKAAEVMPGASLKTRFADGEISVTAGP